MANVGTGQGDELTPREREFIRQYVNMGMQLELMIGSRGGLAGRALTELYHRDLFNSPLVLDREERVELFTKTGSASKKAGRKVRRKVSGYQLEFGKQLKKLKKKHPRTKISRLMRRAHIATKKVRK
ncbi:MAG: hypothetical protein [Circular genetic element sp.]|jgi:hypothetical protein|nr:MAG: hypothetical protein [Circular genetic element sp.]